MKRILLTGFEPFGGDAINPSWQVAQALNGRVVAGAEVHARVLPCVFGRGRGGALQALHRAIQDVQPQLVLCLGLAANRGAMSLERVAINVDDARIPDNAGAQPVDRPIVAKGPAAYFSSLPIKAMAAAIAAQGLAAEVSQTAGTFVCNHVFYDLMHRFAGQRAVRGGFMHLPATAEMATGSAWTVPQLASGVGLALEVALRTRRDLAQAGGAVA